MQVAIFGGARDFVAARRASDVAASGRQRLEDRVQALHGRLFAADHHAIAALQAPHAAAGADIYIMNSLGREFLAAADIVNVIRISAIDNDVVLLQLAA